MSNTVHYIEQHYLVADVQSWKTLCGIKAIDSEFDASFDRAKVECKRCRELLGERVTWPVEPSNGHQQPNDRS